MNRSTFLVIFLLLVAGAALGVAVYLKSGKPAGLKKEEVSDTIQDTTPQDITPQKKEVSPEASPTPPPVTTQTIEDPSGYFSLEVPKGWSFEKGLVKGARLAEVISQSPDYKMTVDDTVEGPHSLIYYEQGAIVTVVVLQGEQSAQDKPAMAMIQDEKTQQVAGVQAVIYTFKEPSTEKGILKEARFAYQGNSYIIRVGYNPETYPQGEAIFESILSSFVLKGK